MHSGCSNSGHGAPSDGAKLVKATLAKVAHKLLVLSGKGGVGKSTVAVNLAVALAQNGKRVGLLDIDVHGPSVPGMLGLDGARPETLDGGFSPLEIGDLKVMSLGFLLRDSDTPVIWRGPMKMSAIEQLLGQTAWGELDYLVVDCPPGTGDEPLSIAQMIPDAEALIVTTPQRVATLDVRKSISFCRQMGLKILGVVENMNGVVCPDCGKRIDVFPAGMAARMCQEMQVPLLASLPIDPSVSAMADRGINQMASAGKPTQDAMAELVMAVLANREEKPAKTTSGSAAAPVSKEGSIMRIAIPVSGGRLCGHFGHCEVFAFLDVEEGTKRVVGRVDSTPPPHEPGVIPGWVASQGAHVVLAGGMGARAISLFEQAGVKVFTGCPANTPEELVNEYLAGTLERGGNRCDDSGHNCGK